MINPMELTGHTVLVTGASSGIGRETAILLGQLGARVILVARNETSLVKTLSKLEGTGHHIEPFDLTGVEKIPGWLKKIAAKFKNISGLVHCAGIQITSPLRYIRMEDIDATLCINLKAAISLTKGFRQKTVCANGGSIVYLSSVMGLVGQPAQTAYVASKGALVALSKAMALELARDSIRVNCVAPAVVQTAMTEKLRDTLTPEQFELIVSHHPLGIGKARDVANAIAFLLAETGRWITGTTLVIDGGYTAH